MIRVVIFGCRKIAVDVIDYITKHYSDRCKIVGVVSHDEERDLVYHNKLVSEFCDDISIPWVRFDDNIEKNVIDNFAPDLIFSLYYRKILKQEILDIPKMGCINIHPAFLPEGRGPAPSLWNVLNGEEYGGSTMHYMVEGVDAGDIIARQKVEIGNMSGADLNVYLSELGFNLFKENFVSVLEGTNNRVPQNHDKATYTLPFKKSLRYISWDKPEQILNQLRAFAKPFDGALTWTTKGTKVIIWKAKILPERRSFSAPGFFETVNNGFIVQTCTLPMLVTEMDVVEGTLKKKGRFVSGPPVV